MYEYERLDTVAQHASFDVARIPAVFDCEVHPVLLLPQGGKCRFQA